MEKLYKGGREHTHVKESKSPSMVEDPRGGEIRGNYTNFLLGPNWNYN